MNTQQHTHTAAAKALKEIPTVNAVIDGDDIVYRDYIDMSVAVSSPTGLVVSLNPNLNPNLSDDIVYDYTGT